MAPDYVLYYNSPDWYSDWYPDWYPEWYNYYYGDEYYSNDTWLEARSDSNERIIENTLAQIVACNYTFQEQENTDTELFDQKTICGIGQTDLTDALEYLQVGFQITWKIEESFNHTWF